MELHIHTRMNNKLFSSVFIGTSLSALALGIASPASAFVITNTSGSWDNATLSGGSLVGSSGVAASVGNDVIFRNDGNDSQVRWGDSVEGYGAVWDFSWNSYYAGYETYYGEYYSWHEGGWVEDYYHYEYFSDYEKKSGLGFTGVSDLNVTEGQTFQVGNLTHFNQTIWGNGKDATSAEFSLDLDFGDFGIGTQTFDFTFSVDETDNHAEVCPYLTTGDGGCSDRITWDWAIDESSSFMHEGQEYTLELVGFSEQVAASSIVNEFISQEKRDNSAGLFAKLVTVDRTKDIPEPASLLGLAGLGLFFLQSGKKRVSQLLD